MQHPAPTTAFPSQAPTLDPEGLEHWLGILIATYQRSRAALDAWAVCHCARALADHPDYHGCDEQRCVYRRLVRQWDWLATRDAHRHHALTVAEVA